MDGDRLLEILAHSVALGLLTGDESKVMISAHIAASRAIGEPFVAAKSYSFGTSSLSQRVSALGSLMLQHRLKAPPKEVYSLHRRLSGSYLACIKLNASVKCDDILHHVMQNYDWGAAPMSSAKSIRQ